MSNWEVLGFIVFLAFLFGLYLLDWAPGREEAESATFHERDGGPKGGD